ncbi:F-box/FBD/LRR-repeat protein At1g13570 [Linum perenne]
MARRRRTDRISNVPDDVREQILMFLPLKDAAKSSILSTKWRNMWTNLPTIVIDESFGDEIAARGIKDKRKEVVGKLVMFEVCRVLMLHHGQLKDFSISLHKWGNQVDQILRFLPFGTLERLTIVNGGYCKLSKQLLSSFSQLKVLCLSYCTFTFSPVLFEGFDALTVLELRKVLFEETKPDIRFRCPLLTTLILDSYEGHLENIITKEAPKLSCFYVVGSFTSLRWSSNASLKNVTIHQNQTSSLFISVKEIHFNAVESLSLGNIWKFMTPLKPWVKLRQLSLDEVHLSTPSRVSYVVGMIMNCPNLQRLAIRMALKSGLTHVDENSDDEAELKDVASEYEDSRMLRKVELKRMRGTDHEITLISWLLINSPELDKMEIELSSALTDSEKLKVVIKLTGFQRTSSTAQIVIN